MRLATPILVRQPRAHPSQVDFRVGLPAGPVHLVARVALETTINVSAAPDVVVTQSRILAVRVTGKNPGGLMVGLGGVSAQVGNDGTFTIRSGGGGPAGVWREMLVGRLEGRRLLVSIYQCDLIGDRGRGVPPLVCKVIFRGTSWNNL